MAKGELPAPGGNRNVEERSPLSKLAAMVLAIAAAAALLALVHRSDAHYSVFTGPTGVSDPDAGNFWRSDLAAAPKRISELAEVPPKIGDPASKGFDFDEFLKSLFIDVDLIFNPDAKCSILNPKYYEIGCSFSMYGMLHLCFLLISYAYILYIASDMISNGSELLLLVPSLAGIVGSVVLPVLGAVPDGAIVLFSGMGPAEKVQQALNVGVGALAGSTIMLLTIPWSLSIWAGRVDLDERGQAKGYRAKPKLSASRGMGWTTTGVEVGEQLAVTGRIMLYTAVPYVIIQGSAFMSDCGTSSETSGGKCEKGNQHWFALAGLVYCIAAFVGYLTYQVKSVEDGVENNHVVQAAVAKVAATMGKNLRLRYTFSDDQIDAESKHFQDLLRPLFNQYDRDPRDGKISRSELSMLLKDIGEDPTNCDVIFKEFDSDRSGEISLEEFFKGIAHLLKAPAPTVASMPCDTKLVSGNDVDDEGDEDEDEDEEVPDDLKDLSEEEQQFRIKCRSGWMMGLGTSLVLLFSDPMVDVLSGFGNAVHLGPFYASFVLAPLASNAAEFIGSMNYAAKKTRKTMMISLSQLQGAACMNNSFCLGIFLALIFFKKLSWQFSAETISILTVELVLFYYSLRTIHRSIDAAVVLLAFPGSLFIVYALENWIGLD